MDEKPLADASPEPAKRHHQFIIALIVAALVFLFFDLVLNKIIETPLRQISSIIGQFILNFFYTDVVRDGTILTVSNFRFEVVGACSGSTTLKVLTGLGIFWVGTYPRLTLWRRIFAGVLTVPIAIISNGVRVAMLVAGSVALNKPIAEGFVHTLFGLITFSLALACFFLLTDRLALDKSRKIKSAGAKKKWIAIGILLFFLYLPFLSRLVSEWIGARFNPYNHIGTLFFTLGIALGGFAWVKAPKCLEHQKAGMALFFLALITALAAIMIDLKLLLGISMLGMLLSFALLFKGARLAAACLPLLGLMYLSFPKIPVQIGTLTSYLGFSGWANDLLIRSVLALLLLIIFFVLKGRISNSRPAQPPVFKHLNLILLPTILAVCFQAYFAISPMKESQNNTLSLSFLLGDWVGRNLEIDKHSLNYFGQGRIWKRRYRKGKDYVDVIINSSGGDRSLNHPPEYCQTGAGFIFDKSEIRDYLLPNQKTISVTQIEMHKDQYHLLFLYWFSDGKSNYADYIHMMLDDTGRRLIGKKTDWFLFRVMSPSQEAIEDFMASFAMEIVGKDKQD